MADGLNDMKDGLETLVDRADIDGLVRFVDGLGAAREWKEILRCRDLCRAATRTGRQVWPIATLCEYRLALHAPAEWACRVVDDEASRFSIGPLTEVVAQNHSWSEMQDHLTTGPHRDIVAQERVIRGETIDVTTVNTATLHLPFRMCDWEPEYSLATYSDEGFVAPCPTDSWTHEWNEMPATSEALVDIDDDETESALRALVEPWTAASSGSARCFVVEGHLDSLAASMDLPALRVTRLTPHRALDWLAWCGASGGSHGRRRGTAAGRFNAWWMLSALGNVDWDEATSNGTLLADLGHVLTELEWFRVGSDERHSYELSLAAVDRHEDVTFGLFAYDDPARP